jgi:hypothetical protein
LQVFGILQKNETEHEAKIKDLQAEIHTLNQDQIQTQGNTHAPQAIA